MFSESTLSEIRGRARGSIVEIASSMTNLKQKGKRWTGLCPFHNEKSPSFGVDEDKGLYYCFGCGEGGDAVRLYQKASGLDFVHAVESMGEMYGVDVGSSADMGISTRKAMEIAVEYYTSSLRESGQAKEYIKGRGLSDEECDRYGIGYAPEDFRGLINYSKGKCSLEELEAAGLIRSSERANRHYDLIRGRIVFPIRNVAGSIVGFSGRSMGGKNPKYVNTPETPRFKKGKILYNLDVAIKSIRSSATAVLVEGFTDVISMGRIGIDGCVASMGTSFTDDHANDLAKRCETVIIAYDSDSAGKKAAYKACLSLLGKGLEVRIVDFGEHGDADEYLRAKGSDELHSLMMSSRDAIDVACEKSLRPDMSPRETERSVALCMSMVNSVSSVVARHKYAAKVASLAGVPIGSIGMTKPEPVLIHSEEMEAFSPRIEDVFVMLACKGYYHKSVVPAVSELSSETARKVYEVMYDSIDQGLDLTEKDMGPVLEAVGLSAPSVSWYMMCCDEKYNAEDVLDSIDARVEKKRRSMLAARLKAAEAAGDSSLVDKLLTEIGL